MKKMLQVKKLTAILLCMTFLFGLVFAEGQPVIKETGQIIGPGTYYNNTVMQTDTGNFVINTVETAIGSEFVKIEVGDSGNPIKTQKVSTQALNKSNDNTRVIGSVNGDFHYTKQYKGIPTGTSIVNGEVKTAMGTNAVLGVTKDGQCFVDDLTLNGALYYQESTYPIDKVNKPHWNDQIIVYTSAYGAATTSDGNSTEIILKGVEIPFKANTLYTATVEKVIKNAKCTPIPADGIIISGIGLAAQSLAMVAEGQQMSFNVSFSNTEVVQAVSGFPMLVKNGEVMTAEIAAKVDAVPGQRQPRTAVGIKEGKVVLITVDGRQAGTSDGMTLYELAEYMKQQGITNALNLDGGGSTAMVVRKQNTKLPALINKPSDGVERAIGNTIQIISEAPVSEPSIVAFNQKDVLIYKGSAFTPTFYLMDQYYNPLDIGERAITYSVDKTASVSETGTYTAGKAAGPSFLDVAIDTATGKLPVTIVDKVGSLALESSDLNVEMGQKVQLNLKAYDENGREIIISPAAVTWSVTGGIGVVDKKGLFTAGKKNGEGKISVKIADKIAEAPAKVGKLPLTIVNFEEKENLVASAVKGTAAINNTKKGEPVKIGKTAIKLNYNFDKKEEQASVAYVAFKTPEKIIGKPIEVGMWVYGDKAAHWLRGSYINSKGQKKVVDFTAEEKLDFKGWKYVYTEIPKTEAFPISWEQVYLAEPSKEKKNSGVIYLDSLTAVYKYEKDNYSPEVAKASVAQAAVLSKSPAAITIDVTDKGTGINSKTIKLLLNNKAVTCKFDAKTGKITYKPSKALKNGAYQLKLTMKDKAGNSLNPEYLLKFTVKAK